MSWNLEIADSETENRLVDNIGDAHSQYEPPSIWNGSFDPSSQPLQEIFQVIPRYQPVSPAISEQSSRDQAPSLHTDYNVEFEGGDPFLGGSPPRRPMLNASTVDFQSPFPPAGLMEYYQTFDPRPPGMSMLLPASPPTLEPIVCSECYHYPRFNRVPELTRHINEQHRCPFGDCTQLRFSNREKKLEHERGHREGGLGFLCGTCSLYGIPPKPLVRMEKLTKHLKDTHKIPKNSELHQCKLKPCYLGPSCGGIYFSSHDDMEEHIGIQHPLHSSRGVTPNGRNYRSIVPKTLIKNASVDNKRSHVPDPEPEIKRLKQKRGTSDSTPLHENFAPCEPRNFVDPRVDSHNTSPNPPDSVEETLKLSVIDLQTLTKQSNWEEVLKKLSSLHISPTFDCKNAAIKLRGPCSVAELEEGKTLLLVLITQLRPMTFRDESAHKCVRSEQFKPTAVFHQQVSVHPQPEIYALNPKEDADTLKLWNTRLLPRFPDMIREALIEGSYSVALVRQNGPNGSQPIIRFRSSGNQGEMSRQIIRESVETICIDNRHQTIHVQFTEGTMVRLVGGSSHASFVNDPSNDDKFPHARRPWARPGMGASIGLSQCPHVSATLGGYISIDGRTYMLTVDHFISECSCVVDTQLRSPSISDVADVKDQLKKRFQQLSLKISRSALNEVPLGQLDEMLFTLDLNEELEHYKRFERELDDEDERFTLGKIRHRCGGAMAPLRKSVNPDLDGLSHHMDWSLSEITAKHRVGKNVHRYGRVASPSLDDLDKELVSFTGCGIPCETIGEATGGEAAYYVGTTSGLREGYINPALIQYGDEYGVSHEWSMVVPHCEALKDSDFQGDSGAWIISNDNKLLGLLWGWDNGNLLFTPIQDVFADITQKMKCHKIELLDNSSGSRSKRSGSLLCRTEVEIEQYIPKQLVQETIEFDEPVIVSPSMLSPFSIVQRRRNSSVSSIGSWSMCSTPGSLSSSSSLSFSDEPPSHPNFPTKDQSERKMLSLRPKFQSSPTSAMSEVSDLERVQFHREDTTDELYASPMGVKKTEQEPRETDITA